MISFNGFKRVRDEVFGDDKAKRFGSGNPKIEENCETFHVYMMCKGYLSNDKRYSLLERGSTIADARAAFGRPIRQQRVTDEDGYAVNLEDLISQHSQGCRVSLLFSYDKTAEIKGLFSYNRIAKFLVMPALGVEANM
eukprot:2157732-Pyramimonas_sp.AAC.1